MRRLHESVYRLALPGMRLTGPFEPHLTVGRSTAADERAAAVRAAGELALPISGLASALTVYRLDGAGARRRERELLLGR